MSIYYSPHLPGIAIVFRVILIYFVWFTVFNLPTFNRIVLCCEQGHTHTRSNHHSRKYRNGCACVILSTKSFTMWPTNRYLSQSLKFFIQFYFHCFVCYFVFNMTLGKILLKARARYLPMATKR
ncbi:hypothetical protein BX661DRAFT_184997 [Kickxella alabastrina]|uniref:uncharacterized protein n=1 Tax=Kickxella alabastrina TaxID=61397 RepID=UPI00222000EA|nr:uncharacterized protein BX661DRAFT_184997 [Kickxella alabastrina]KAI7824942.1 hypothetical protein BX661DRAFT_184997 [Kickxella alabastrina]